MDFRIERAHAHDWRRVRAIRLRALEDAPDAFGSTLEGALAMPDEEWQARAARETTGTFLAVDTSVRSDDHDRDRDVGLVATMPYEGKEAGSAGLFSMWVAPGARRFGVGRALIAAVLEWARAAGFARVYLDVGDHNDGAIALYARMGFRATGLVGTLDPPRSHITEHERVHVFA